MLGLSQPQEVPQLYKAVGAWIYEGFSEFGNAQRRNTPQELSTVLAELLRLAPLSDRELVETTLRFPKNPILIQSSMRVLANYLGMNSIPIVVNGLPATPDQSFFSGRLPGFFKKPFNLIGNLIARSPIPPEEYLLRPKRFDGLAVPLHQALLLPKYDLITDPQLIRENVPRPDYLQSAYANPEQLKIQAAGYSIN